MYLLGWGLVAIGGRRVIRGAVHRWCCSCKKTDTCIYKLKKFSEWCPLLALLVYYGWAELLWVGLTDTYAAMAGPGTVGRRTECCFAVRGTAAVEWGILYLRVKRKKSQTTETRNYVYLEAMYLYVNIKWKEDTEFLRIYMYPLTWHIGSELKTV